MPLSGDEVRRRDGQVRVVLGVGLVLLALLVGGHLAGWSWILWLIPLVAVDVFVLSVEAAFWSSREENLLPMEWWRAFVSDGRVSLRDQWRRGGRARVRLVIDLPWQLLSWGGLWGAARVVTGWTERRGA
jgi:hypothetical protein